MRIALVYDCLYPHSVGGAERWLRALAERLSDEHEVTYLTRRQWPRGERPIEGVRCVAVAPGGPLYAASGRRRLLPPTLFGAGVFLHLARRRHHYDVVHCLSYPFVPLLAARLALAGARGPRLFVEWLECLSATYWRTYAGPVGGRAGHVLQTLCVRLTPQAFCFSALVESRLRAAGFRGRLHRLTGLWAGEDRAAGSQGGDPEGPFLLFAGRHVPDKRAMLLLEALALARRERPDLRAVVVGEGPERGRLLERVARLGLDGAVTAPGFVPGEELASLMARAACVVSPSRRDGYGMVVVEAAAAGTPAVVVRGPDSAATELVEEGVNGAVAERADPEELARAILRVMSDGERLRHSTAEWFAANRDRLSITSSIDAVLEAYRGA